MTKNPYHKFLIKHRRYCEHDGCRMKLTQATRVINRNGRDYVYCAFHGYGALEQGLRDRARLEAK